LSSREALDGKTGKNIIADYRGARVLSAYTPLKVWGTTWALIAEIDETEAFAAVECLKRLTGLVAVIALAAIVAVTFWLAGHIVGPVSRVISLLVEVSDRVASASAQLSSSSRSLSEGSSEQAASSEETSASLEEISIMAKQNAKKCSPGRRAYGRGKADRHACG